MEPKYKHGETVYWIDGYIHDHATLTMRPIFEGGVISEILHSVVDPEPLYRLFGKSELLKESELFEKPDYNVRIKMTDWRPKPW